MLRHKTTEGTLSLVSYCLCFMHRPSSNYSCAFTTVTYTAHILMLTVNRSLENTLQEHSTTIIHICCSCRATCWLVQYNTIRLSADNLRLPSQHFSCTKMSAARRYCYFHTSKTNNTGQQYCHTGANCSYWLFCLWNHSWRDSLILLCWNPLCWMYSVKKAKRSSRRKFQSKGFEPSLDYKCCHLWDV